MFGVRAGFCLGDTVFNHGMKSIVKVTSCPLEAFLCVNLMWRGDNGELVAEVSVEITPIHFMVVSEFQVWCRRDI